MEIIMELLLALDFVDIDGAKSILDEVADLIDVVEVGTPFLVREGVRAIRELRSAFPGLQIMADLKLVDAGGYETRIALEAGANIVSVLGVADSQTFQGALQAAREINGKVLADMICVADVAERSMALDQLGVDYLCVHTGVDVQTGSNTALEQLATVRALGLGARVAIAGGITPRNIESVAALSPDLVIVGSGITKAPNRRMAASDIRTCCTGGR